MRNDGNESLFKSSELIHWIAQYELNHLNESSHIFSEHSVSQPALISTCIIIVYLFDMNHSRPQITSIQSSYFSHGSQRIVGIASIKNIKAESLSSFLSFPLKSLMMEKLGLIESRRTITFAKLKQSRWE